MSNATTHIETEKQLVPALRFKEFNGDWNEILLDNFAQRGSGHTPSKSHPEYYNGDINWISLTDSKRLDNGFIEDTNTKITQQGIDNSSAVLHPAGTVVLSRDAGVGKSAVMKHSMAVSQHFIVWKSEEGKSSNWFLYNWLQIMKPHFEIIAVGNTIKTIGLPYFKKLKIVTPKFPEQQKIASFLSAVDEKIQQLTKKKALLEQYKKGVMQQLFRSAGSGQASGQLRFKDENGNSYPDWEEKKLNHYLKVSRTKNLDLEYDKNDVLSVSGQFGIVNQIEFQGRSFAGESVHNYGLVENGDIVYTKSPLKSNPYGIIKVNKDKTGIVSTLYAVYKCKPTLIGEYLDYYFQLDDNTNRYLRPLVQKGSKNDMKINNDKVLIDPILIPSTIEEQQKVVDYLEELDSKILIANNQITQTQTFKKGLLQQMFV
jgi:type I restriction enzyme S subunit